MIERFPLDSDEFRLNFGVRAMAADEPIIFRTEHYQEEIASKAELLGSQRERCWAAAPESSASQAEAVRFLKARCCQGHPIKAACRNVMGRQLQDDHESPLLEVSRKIQEDLVILRHDPNAGFPVIAGSVCFPSGWSIADKLGQSQGCVHAAVPGFDGELLSPSLKLYHRLKPGRTVSRNNWGIRALTRLAQFPCDAEEIDAASKAVTLATASGCMFRVEFQTLSRLPDTQSLLFTIHTHQQPLRELSRSQKQRLASVISTCPESTLRYKGIWPMKKSVCEYLQTT